MKVTCVTLWWSWSRLYNPGRTLPPKHWRQTQKAVSNRAHIQGSKKKWCNRSKYMEAHSWSGPRRWLVVKWRIDRGSRLFAYGGWAVWLAVWGPIGGAMWPFGGIEGPLMTSGVLCCYRGTLMAALEALSVAVAIGAFVPWHPPQSQSTGTNIYFGLTPKVKAGPLDPLGPQFEVDSLSDFRASRDGSGPSGQIRAPQDKPGPNRTNQGPAERIRASLGQPEPRGANQGPAGRVRAPGRIGSRGMSQGPAEKNQRTGTDQGTAGRISALHTGPARAPQDE